MKRNKVTMARQDAMWVSIRQQLKDRREAIELDQADLARRIGKTQSYVSKYENGHSKLDVVECFEIFSVLNNSGIDDVKNEFWIENVLDEADRYAKNLELENRRKKRIR